MKTSKVIKYLKKQVKSEIKLKNFSTNTNINNCIYLCITESFMQIVRFYK